VLALENFLSENSGVIVGAITTSLGLLIGVLTKQLDFRYSIKMQGQKYKDEFKSQYVVEPILCYLKLDLKMAQAVYAGALNQQKVELDCSSQGDVVYIETLAYSLNDKIGNSVAAYNREKIILNTLSIPLHGEAAKVNEAYESLIRLKGQASKIIGELGRYN
jgi:hypothetical protein